MSEPPVRAILFDIGGVVVKSPMQSIVNYETAHNIPSGWVNFAISRSSARSDGSGAWSQLEQGKIPLDGAFFNSFHSDLHDYTAWRDFCVRHAANSKAPLTQSSPIPPLPQMDTTSLFWAMMIYSRNEDQDMTVAIEKLRASGRFVIAALSNTVPFPAWHPFSHVWADDVRTKFDVFVSSAHAGVRKPNRDAYEMAVSEVDHWSRQQGKGGVQAENIIFLDDIGQNLKGARESGLRTIKVPLGKTIEAVKELEKLVDLCLTGTGDKQAKL